jgi:hypothetical protein
MKDQRNSPSSHLTVRLTLIQGSRRRVNISWTMSTIVNAEAATFADDQSILHRDDNRSKRRRAVHRAVQSATSRDILLFLIAFRVLNALSIRTFFQPDEYFQSLEPAWHMVFGKDSGAWITWVLSDPLLESQSFTDTRKGVGTSSTVGDTSSDLCRSVLHCFHLVADITVVSSLPGRSVDRSAEGLASGFCSFRRSLYLEVGRESLRAREQRGLGCCT